MKQRHHPSPSDPLLGILFFLCIPLLLLIAFGRPTTDRRLANVSIGTVSDDLPQPVIEYDPDGEIKSVRFPHAHAGELPDGTDLDRWRDVVAGTPIVSETSPPEEAIPLAATPLLFVRRGDRLFDQLSAICGSVEEADYWWPDVALANNLSEREYGLDGFQSDKLLLLPLKMAEDRIGGDPRLLAVAILRDGDCYWNVWRRATLARPGEFADWSTSMKFNKKMSAKHGRSWPGDCVYLPGK